MLKIADGLKRIGEKHNATAGQAALAWLLAQSDNIIPIPGTKKISVKLLFCKLVNFYTNDDDDRLSRRTWVR